MEKEFNKKKKFLKNTICSLYEVENFLCQYNKFSDILSILKIIKRQTKK